MAEVMNETNNTPAVAEEDIIVVKDLKKYLKRYNNFPKLKT